MMKSIFGKLGKRKSAGTIIRKRSHELEKVIEVDKDEIKKDQLSQNKKNEEGRNGKINN